MTSRLPTRRFLTPLGALPRLVLASAFALSLSACETTDEAKAKKAQGPQDLYARLAATQGSAAFGSVRFHPVEGGVEVMAYVWTGTSGSFRVVLHSGGLCNSPNGFSAGPPYVPPGFSAPIDIMFTAGTNGQGSTIEKVPKLVLEGPDGLFGKSVVIHLGSNSSLEAQPGVPNNRIACGVIGPSPKGIEF